MNTKETNEQMKSHMMSTKEVIEMLDKEYEESQKKTDDGFIWDERIISWIIAMIFIGVFSVSVANVIEMLVNGQFVYWKLVANIIMGTVSIYQWVCSMSRK